jgi:predicted ATPase
MADTANKVKELLRERKVVFIRSGVGNGKTTLAHYLAKDERFHLVDFPTEAVRVDTYDAITTATRNIASTICSSLPKRRHGLKAVLRILGDAGHVLVFDEAHILFGIPQLCDVLFKDPKCPVLLFSASSEAKAGPDNEHAVTPAGIAKYMWYPRALSEHEVQEMVDELCSIGIGINVTTLRVLYMIAGGNRDIFMNALRWLQAENVSKEDALATVRLGLAKGWNALNGLLCALKWSRAVKANGGYDDVRDIPEQFVQILAGGPQNISSAAMRRPLTIGGLILPVVDNHASELVRYDWNDVETQYGVSSTLRAAFYNRSLKFSPFFMTHNYDPTDAVITCAELLARACPRMGFTDVMQRPVPGAEEEATLSLASAIMGCGLAPEDDYNAAFQRALCEQGFDMRNFNSPADGGKIDHLVWDSPQNVNPKFGLEFLHFGTKSQRREHASRFAKENRATYGMAKSKALVVLCTSQDQVETVIQEAREDTAMRASNADVIALLVRTSHESYTMTAWMAGEASPWEPLVFACDGVAKKIVTDERGKRTLESAQRLQHIGVRLLMMQRDGMGGMLYYLNALAQDESCADCCDT